MAPTEPPLVVLDRYALFDAMARGGMASVHLGRLMGAAGFSKIVAVKRMHEHLASNQEFVNMFVDEARLAGRLQHPNVVNVVDVIAKDNEAFLVMEYIHGESLSGLLKAAAQTDDWPPVDVSVQIVRGALEGLHAAHEAKNQKGEPMQLVHRDVSPQNMLVGTDGVARVLDFGIAKAVGRLQHSATGQVKGKTSYMSPEQVTGSHVDRRADVYAAGVVLWECLAQKRLFAGENSAEIVYRILEEPIPPLNEEKENISEQLAAVVARATNRWPKKRFQTALEFAQALEECAEVLPARTLGTWVKNLAGEKLAEREARVRAIEALELETPVGMPSAPELSSRASSPDLVPAPASASADDETEADQPVTSPAATATMATRRKTIPLQVWLGAGVLVTGLLVWVMVPTGSGSEGDGVTGPAGQSADEPPAAETEPDGTDAKERPSNKDESGGDETSAESAEDSKADKKPDSGSPEKEKPADEIVEEKPAPPVARPQPVSRPRPKPKPRAEELFSRE